MAIEFDVSVYPDGSSKQGSMGYPDDANRPENIDFYVIIKAKVKAPKNQRPNSIQFLLSRGSTSQRETGYLITSSNDSDAPKNVGGGLWEYTYRTFGQRSKTPRLNWNITRLKGRYRIRVQNHSSNTVQFKIDKRSQISHFARAWDGEPQNYEAQDPTGLPGETIFLKNKHGGPTCNDFVGFVYTYLGLSIDTRAKRPDGKRGRTYTASVREYLEQMNPDTDDLGIGAVLFYHSVGQPNAWRHNGIFVGGNPNQIVNQNLGFHGGRISKHSAFDNRFRTENNYDPTPVFRSTKELQNLDNE